MVNNMELTANQAEAYLVGGQLKKRKRKRKRKVCLYKIRGQTHQLHMHLRQHKIGLQYMTKRRRKINIH